MKNFSVWSRSRLFCLEPEPTQVGRSRSRLRDLSNQEPEPPKKVAAPQHCFLEKWNLQKKLWLKAFFIIGAGAGAGEKMLGAGPGPTDHWQIVT